MESSDCGMRFCGVPHEAASLLHQLGMFTMVERDRNAYPVSLSSIWSFGVRVLESNLKEKAEVYLYTLPDLFALGTHQRVMEIHTTLSQVT